MPVAGALIGAVASIGGGLLASGGGKSAANAQAESNALAIAEQRRQYDTTRGDLMPWQKAGQSALGIQGDLLGLNGAQKQQAAIQQLQGSPLYQSLFNNGRDTLLANASATGGLRGGNTQGALANFGRDTLAGVIENQLSQLGSVSTIGQNSAVQTGAAGQGSANSISELLARTGQANASGILGGAGATVAGINSAAGSLAQLLKGIGGGNDKYGSLTSAIPAWSPVQPVQVGNIDVGTTVPF